MRYQGIRVSGYQGMRYQGIRVSGHEVSGYQGMRYQGIRVCGIRVSYYLDWGAFSHRPFQQVPSIERNQVQNKEKEMIIDDDKINIKMLKL